MYDQVYPCTVYDLLYCTSPMVRGRCFAAQVERAILSSLCHHYSSHTSKESTPDAAGGASPTTEQHDTFVSIVARGNPYSTYCVPQESEIERAGERALWVFRDASASVLGTTPIKKPMRTHAKSARNKSWREKGRLAW